MALRIFGVALIVGGKSVALKADKIAPQISPLCTRLGADKAAGTAGHGCRAERHQGARTYAHLQGQQARAAAATGPQGLRLNQPRQLAGHIAPQAWPGQPCLVAAAIS